MQTKPPTRILRSVFAKLLGVILVAGICLNLLMGAFFHYIFRSQALTPVQRNAVQYVDYLIQDLGSPPSLERAREIAARASLKIRYDGPDMSWSTTRRILLDSGGPLHGLARTPRHPHRPIPWASFHRGQAEGPGASFSSWPGSRTGRPNT